MGFFIFKQLKLYLSISKVHCHVYFIPLKLINVIVLHHFYSSATGFVFLILCTISATGVVDTLLNYLLRQYVLFCLNRWFMKTASPQRLFLPSKVLPLWAPFRGFPPTTSTSTRTENSSTSIKYSHYFNPAFIKFKAE